MKRKITILRKAVKLRERFHFFVESLFNRYYLYDAKTMTFTKVYRKHFERNALLVIFGVFVILGIDFYMGKMSEQDDIKYEMELVYNDSIARMKDSLSKWPIIETITECSTKKYEYVPTQQELESNVNINTYDADIRYASQIYDIPEAIIKAVISVESSFDPNATSSAGAKGLMQVMPSNYEHLRISNPHNAYDIIMGGSQFLKGLYVRYGDWTMVFKYYNGGAKGISNDPAPETIEYVKKINARLKIK